MAVAKYNRKVLSTLVMYEIFPYKQILEIQLRKICVFAVLLETNTNFHPHTFELI